MRIRKSSFFKVLLDVSAPELRIPPRFVRRFGEKLQQKSLLKANGKSWTVKIEQIDRFYCFTKGWHQFVKDNCLDEGYFLVFRLSNKSNFRVVIFDTTCCEKEVDSPSTHHKNGSDPPPRRPKRAMENPCNRRTTRSMTSKRAKTDAAAEGSRNVHVKKEIESEEDIIEIDDSATPPSLSFSMDFTAANQYCMAIPEDFALETGIAHEKRVVLVDPNGKRWPIDLRLRKDGRMKMNNGWDDFQKAFKVAPGVTCTFEFIKGSCNVLKVQVKRKRGRPPKM